MSGRSATLEDAARTGEPFDRAVESDLKEALGEQDWHRMSWDTGKFESVECKHA